MVDFAHLRTHKTMIYKTLSATILGWLLVFALMAFPSCNGPEGGFTAKELDLINGADSIMRVLTIEDAADSIVLRNTSSDLSAAALTSDDFTRLSELMVATVTHPSQDGVGIAAPQVGLNRRVIAVQRFDKEGEPFEVYPNIRIVSASDSLVSGGEGCLSVPDMRGNVLRSESIVIEYADIESVKDEVTERHKNDTASMRMDRKKVSVPTIRDTVSGFTAVIFQHEIDHLEGVLYIDRL